MATKFYLHDAAASGTTPSSTLAFPGPTIDSLVTNGWRTMNTTIGSAQASKAITTQANTSAQSAAIVGFCSAPLEAQTITSQAVSFSGAASEGSTNSNFFVTIGITLWRPSTTSIVTRIYNPPAATTTEAGTTQTALTVTQAASTSATAQAGDILVLELWRGSAAQAMGTAYANTVFYDGTTEASTTSCAAFINFPTSTLTFQSVAATPPTKHRNMNREAVHRAHRW